MHLLGLKLPVVLCVVSVADKCEYFSINVGGHWANGGKFCCGVCHFYDGAVLRHEQESIKASDLEYALEELLVDLFVLAISWLPFEFGGYRIRIGQACSSPIEHVVKPRICPS